MPLPPAFPNAFPEAQNVVTTGNPVRQDICEVLSPSWRYQSREAEHLPLKVLVVGGSLGAQALNERIPAALAALNMPLSVYHQCGQKQVDETQQRYANLQAAAAGLNVEVSAFIDDMAKAYSDADLVICRAGALTVTEIATAGVAAVFVPLPTAVDDHQTANAQFLAQVGAAKICPQATLTSESLAQVLKPLMNRATLSEMAAKARQQAQVKATKQVADLIELL